ncbi:HNH endonuclease [Pseudomonas syringae]|uniref:HNH endonuclease n=1 Tax=Pseudomonas syringae TaxID=317 RepID=UPI0021564778|nr:HNH endonuclease [Pseudomonas syringae]
MDTLMQDVFAKFQCSSVFSAHAADWSSNVRDDFAEFVMAVHDSGLDLWTIADGQVRAGNKSNIRSRAEVCLAWIKAQKKGPVISFSRLVAGTDTPWEAVGKSALERLQAPGFLRSYPIKSRDAKWPNNYIRDQSTNGELGGYGLNTEQIVTSLEHAGFVVIPLPGRKVFRLKHSALDQPVYVKRGAGQSMRAPLVLHPTHASKISGWSEIYGVELSEDLYYHNSNLRGFPKRTHNGATPISYGIALGVRDSATMIAILQSLIDPGSLDGESQSISAAMTIDEGVIALNETERAALIKARIGQSRYRDSLLKHWGGCSVTECSIPHLLRASHIKPWRDANHAERLDQFNGLLLTPNLDLAFDQGLISFDDDGDILLSAAVDEATASALHLNAGLKLRHIDPRHRSYLAWHREKKFQN